MNRKNLMEEKIERLTTLLYNAIGYMLEDGLSTKAVEDYLGASVEELEELVIRVIEKDDSLRK